MGGGWLDADNRAISVQLNLTGTATGTELGNNPLYHPHSLTRHLQDTLQPLTKEPDTPTRHSPGNITLQTRETFPS